VEEVKGKKKKAETLSKRGMDIPVHKRRGKGRKKEKGEETSHSLKKGKKEKSVLCLHFF